MKFSEIPFWNSTWATYQSCVSRLCFCSLASLSQSSSFLVSRLPWAHSTKESRPLWLKSNRFQISPEIFETHAFHLTARSGVFSNARPFISRSLWFLDVCSCYVPSLPVFPICIARKLCRSQNKETHSPPERRGGSSHQAENWFLLSVTCNRFRRKQPP